MKRVVVPLSQDNEGTSVPLSGKIALSRPFGNPSFMIQSFLNTETAKPEALQYIKYKLPNQLRKPAQVSNSPLQDLILRFARKREKITQRRRWLDEWSERCQNAQCAHSFHSGDVCQHISLIIFNPITHGLFLSLEFLVVRSERTTWPWYFSYEGSKVPKEIKVTRNYVKLKNYYMY